MHSESLDELLDRVVAEYSDELTKGIHPDPQEFLARVPEEARPALERSLRMLQVGLAHAPSASTPLTAGTVLDGFRLIREIGRGGMATVWLAEQEDLCRPIALKLLRPALAIEQRHIDRFRREGLAVARLNHPNIVQIHAVGEAHGFHYIAMEYIEGKTFAQALANLPEQRPWSPADLARAADIQDLATLGNTYEQCIASVLSSVAQALEAAHTIGIVHRDIKPSNILLRKDGKAVVADFGLAKAGADPALSMSGDTIGTPWYMSPEQAHTIEAQVDERTDVYSLGVTFYEALSGRRPFEGNTALAVLEAIKTKVPRALGQLSPECTVQSEAIARRSMARMPEERYPTAREFALDLRRLANGESTDARVKEGGPIRRMWANFRASTHTGEYKSNAKFLGLPLVHIFVDLGARQRRPGLRIAKGWLAIGDIAIGGFAFGGLSAGLVSFGGLSIGALLAIGGLALGTFATGGGAVGLIAMGGMAMGYLAFGGIAKGYYAIGGKATGTYAAGGDPTGLPIVFGEGGTFDGVWFEPVVQLIEQWINTYQ